MSEIVITEEHKAQQQKYVDKWMKFHSNTDRLDPIETTRIVNEVQVELLGRPATPVLIVDNPMLAWIGCHLSEHEGVPVDQILEEIDKVADEKRKIELEPFVIPYLDGSLSSSVFSYYDFMINEVKAPVSKEMLKKYKVWEKTVTLGMIFPVTNVTMVSQKAAILSMKDGQLHNDGGPAIAFAGKKGGAQWCLNGVVVPQWLAETKGTDINPEMMHKIKSADVRTEFLKKIGIERVLNMGNKIDSWENYPEQEMWAQSEYELWDMQNLFTSVPFAPFLKMSNQSCQGVFHVEAVSPNCTDLKKALQERMQGWAENIWAVA